MTMEEVTSEANLREAFEEVARNQGAPGPDGQTIEYVREHLDELIADPNALKLIQTPL